MSAAPLSITSLPNNSLNLQKQYQQARFELESKYEFHEVLGTGAFSEVKKAVHRETRNLYAIKIIDRKKCAGKENMIQTEVNILKRVQHPNIISLYEMYETENKIYLVMGLVTGGELFDSIVARGHYTEADAAHIVQSILKAIQYLHEMGIVHRDLKPENLLFSSRDADALIMISDFGLSRIFNDDEVMKTACGTPGYVAPEVLKRQGYGKEVDLWSIGVITYILLCGYPPFYDENNQELFQQIMRGDYQFDSPHWDDISTSAKDFIRKLLVVDPRKRATTLQALNHSFIAKHCPVVQKEANLTEKTRANPELHNNLVLETVDIKSGATPVVPAENLRETSTQAIEKNLAERVSSNLRNRGLSVSSRRRSIDANGKRISPYVPTHAPPLPPKPAAIVEEPVPEPRPLVSKSEQTAEDEKKDDSGNVSNGSKESVAQQNLLEIFSRVQQFLGEGKKEEADRLFQDIDLPDHIKSLYQTLLYQNTQKDSEKIRDSENDKVVLATVKKPSSASDATVGPKTVRFLSLSIFLRPPGIKTNHSDYKNARVRYFLSNILPNYDVVTLQECFAYGSTRCEKIIQKAGQLGFKAYLASTSQGIFDCFVQIESSENIEFLRSKIDSGLLVLSRYPLVKTARLCYDQSSGLDRLIARGALYAKIAVPTPSGYRHMHVFTTTMQTSPEASNYIWFNPKEQSISIRSKQQMQLKLFMDEIIRREVPVNIMTKEHDLILLTGNFRVNGRPHARHIKGHTEEYKAMMEIMEGAVRNTSKHLLRLQLNELMFETFGEHPVTYADIISTDGAPCLPAETVLTQKKHYGLSACMDYIFRILVVDQQFDRASTSSPAHCLMIQEGSPRIEKFLVDQNEYCDGAASTSVDSLSSTKSRDSANDSPKTSNPSLESKQKQPERKKSLITSLMTALGGDDDESGKTWKFTQVSDHYGLSTVIQVVEQP